MNYFQNCLVVLGLEEEVALTEEYIRKAYKKAAVRVHPDKGGSEQEFEAVTRAYAYLTDILKRIHGGRSKEGVVQEPSKLRDSRTTESKDWAMVEPVKLNPKKLDLNAFNTMFEKTRIPDPDDEGYGDWLKSSEAAATNAPTFGGKFNRDVFNRTFEDEFKKRTAGTSITATVPQAITLAPGHGVEIGRGASDDYTAPAGGNMRYTDLRKAYTSESTFSNQVANVSVEDRNFAVYSDSRKKAPTALTNSELEAIQAAEQYQQRNEQKRTIRAAQEMTQADQYFQRMKQMVLTTDRR
jgi:curved DNA-binding protein CbpA